MEESSSSVAKKLINLVLLGRTGTGKSATANSIINEDAFKSRTRAQAVTTLIAGKMIEISEVLTVNVIDTPGLFDFNDGPKSADNEIAKCIGLAKDGINAFILVLSVRNRFTPEEHATFQWFQNYFGKKVTDYMIVIYTNGDQLEADNEVLDDYLMGCPQPLKEILKLCDQRVLLFNNRTKNVDKKQKQVDDLLGLVEDICTKNDGKAYTNDIFVELQEAMKIKASQGNTAEGQALFSQHIDNVNEMVASKLAESMNMLQKQLEVQEAAQKAERERNEIEIKRLKESMVHDQQLDAYKKQIEQLEAAHKHEREMTRLREHVEVLAKKKRGPIGGFFNGLSNWLGQI